MTAAPLATRNRMRAASALRASFAALAMMLAGCASGPVDTFDLTATPNIKPMRAPRGQLVITEPIATSPTDSDRIVVRPGADAVATLKGAQWSERLPRLVQTRLVQSFENAHLLMAVGRPGSGIVAQVALTTEIRRFEIDVARGEAVVELAVKLLQEGSGKIIAAQIFSARVPGSADNGQVAAQSLDAALSQVMAQIVSWATPRV